MLYASLVLSLLLLVLVTRAAARAERPARKVFWWCLGLGAGPVFWAAVFPPVLVQAALLILLLPVLRVPRRGRPAYRGAAAVATLGVWAMCLWAVVGQQEEYADLRARYDFEPLDGRLPTRPVTAAPAPAPAGLSELEDAIEDKHRMAAYRTHTLERLHEERVRLFVSSPGFGVVRMVFTPSDSKLKSSRDEGPVPQPGDAPSPPRDPAAGTPDPNRDRAPLADLHRDGLVDFLHPAGWALVRDGRVAGFQPHGMTRVPPPAGGWAVRSVELVGLVMHPEPVAYVSANLPRMDELRAAPTRPLDPFEADALAALRAGEDVVVREVNGAVRMVGSVRATRQCVGCHGGHRGELLGAMSYRLRAK